MTGAASGLALALALVAQGEAALNRPAESRGSIVVEPERAIAGHFVEGPFRQPAGVFFDRHHGELFIVDLGRRLIAIADRKGFPTFSFGSAETLTSPRALVVDRRGRILVADTDHPGVRLFDYDGTPLGDLALGAVPAADRALRAAALALDAEERLHILDTANRRILIVRLGDGALVGAFGRPAGRSELLAAPVDLDLTPTGRIAVADASGLAVQLYDPSGEFIRGWGQHDVGLDAFSLPGGIAVDGAGRIHVADTLRQDVKVFAPDGRFLTNYGGFGTRPGELLYPVDVASDGADRVFVAERVGRRVQVFRVRSRNESARTPTRPAGQEEAAPALPPAGGPQRSP